MVGQLIYLQDSLLEGVFLLSIAPEFIRGYLSHKIETHPLVIGQRRYHPLLSVGTDIETGKTANQVDAGVAGCFARVHVKNL